MRRQPGDVLGTIVSAAVVALFLSVQMAVSGSDGLAVVVAAASSAAGTVLALTAWMAGGRPRPETMLRRRPGLSGLIFVVFLAGLVPGAVLA